MNSEFEKIFIKNFFDKRCSSRLQYELSSSAKREKFFARMAHTAEDYIKKNVIVKKNKMPFQKSEISDFLFDKNKKCYIIADRSPYDGKLVDYDEVIDILWCCGVPYVIVSQSGDKAYIETEYDFSVHWSYFIKSA